MSLSPAFPLLLELMTLWTPVQNSQARADISNSKMFSKLKICNCQIKFLHAVIMSRLTQGWRKAAFAFVSYAALAGLVVLHLAERGGNEWRWLGQRIKNQTQMTYTVCLTNFEPHSIPIQSARSYFFQFFQVINCVPFHIGGDTNKYIPDMGYLLVCELYHITDMHICAREKKAIYFLIAS